MSIMTVPVFGYGPAVQLRPRNVVEPDLFDNGPTDDELRNNHRIRCRAIQDFLAGRRPDPAVTALDFAGGSMLGGDEFDARLDDPMIRPHHGLRF